MRVFVYGHYDSRGGTTAIAADSRQAADYKYLLDGWPGIEPDAAMDILEEDYLGEADLQGADHFLERAPIDLEWQAGGVVLSDEVFGRHCDPEDDEPLPEAWGDAVVTLTLVSENACGEAPHGRWDDDAYSFVLQKV